jgi:hypothetical protein
LKPNYRNHAKILVATPVGLVGVGINQIET